jgi:hypothetical protein
MTGIGVLAHTPPTRLRSPHHTLGQVTLPVPTTDPQKPFPVSQRSLRTIFPPPSSIIRTTNHRRLFGKIQPHRPATAAVRDYDPICGTCAFTTETAFFARLVARNEVHHTTTSLLHAAPLPCQVPVPAHRASQTTPFRPSFPALRDDSVQHLAPAWLC